MHNQAFEYIKERMEHKPPFGHSPANRQRCLQAVIIATQELERALREAGIPVNNK